MAVLINIQHRNNLFKRLPACAHATFTSVKKKKKKRLSGENENIPGRLTAASTKCQANFIPLPGLALTPEPG